MAGGYVSFKGGRLRINLQSCRVGGRGSKAEWFHGGGDAALARFRVTSAFLSIATKWRTSRKVSSGPLPDSCTAAKSRILLYVNLNPYAHAVRSTRRRSGPVAQVRADEATAIEEFSELHTPQLNCATFY